MWFSISTFIPIQNIDLCTNEWVWSCHSAYFCNTSSITICLPFRITPSITAILSQNIQYVLMSCGIWYLLSGQPCMIYSLRHCWCSSWDIALYSSCIFMHSSLLVATCMKLTFICIPHISVPLFFLWLCMESQSTINRSCSGLYITLTLYWFILSRIHSSLCDSIAMFHFEYSN